MSSSNKKWFWVLVFVVFILFFFVLYLNKQIKVLDTDPAKATVTINKTKVYVEVKNSIKEKEQGLSGKKSLDQNRGMLFNYKDSPQILVFWMKDMLIPIDIIWIKDSKIVKIDANLSPPPTDTPDYNLKQYPSGVLVDYVLEVNAGFAEKNNIKAGDTVKINY